MRKFFCYNHSSLLSILTPLFVGAALLLPPEISILSVTTAHAAQEEDLTLLVVGDSLSDGYGVKRTEAYPALLENKLRAAGLKVKVVNAAESGAISASALSTLQFYQKKVKPDFLLLAIGGNDARAQKPAETIKKNLKKTIAHAEQNNIKVILAGQKIFTNLGKEYGQKFESIYTDLARQHKRVKLIPFLLEGVAGVKSLNIADGFHPNAEGHKKIADHLYPYITETLNSSKGKAP